MRIVKIEKHLKSCKFVISFCVSVSQCVRHRFDEQYINWTWVECWLSTVVSAVDGQWHQWEGRTLRSAVCLANDLINNWLSSCDSIHTITHFMCTSDKQTIFVSDSDIDSELGDFLTKFSAIFLFLLQHWTTTSSSILLSIISLFAFQRIDWLIDLSMDWLIN